MVDRMVDTIYSRVIYILTFAGTCCGRGWRAAAWQGQWRQGAATAAHRGAAAARGFDGYHCVRVHGVLPLTAQQALATPHIWLTPRQVTPATIMCVGCTSETLPSRH
jgi:hypothetical protein